MADPDPLGVHRPLLEEEDPAMTASARVLHVVATGDRRGAETFAGDLVRALGNGRSDQRVAVLRASGAVKVAFTAPTHVLEADGEAGVLAPWRRSRGLRNLVRGWRPDVVQAHGGEALKYSVVATFRTGVPIVYRRIGSAHPAIADRARRMLYGWLMRRATVVICVSETVRRETVEAYGVGLERTSVIPNGVDPQRLRARHDRAQVRASLGVAEDATSVLFVGALNWEKDPLTLTEVARRILEEVPEARFQIVGDGPLRSRVEEVVRARGLRDQIQLLGSRDDVGALLRAADVLALSSRTEGMPAVLIEAGIAGIPIAAYAVGGVAEVVKDGVTGFLAPPGDIDGLTERLLRLIREPELRTEMGRSAVERTMGRFDIALIAPRYAQVYRAVAGMSEGAGTRSS
jgi:glycosyltransferase involved in cell wall biosynthesis